MFITHISIECPIVKKFLHKRPVPDIYTRSYMHKGCFNIKTSQSTTLPTKSKNSINPKKYLYNLYNCNNCQISMPLLEHNKYEHIERLQPDQTLLELRVQPFIKDSTAERGVHTKISNRQAFSCTVWASNIHPFFFMKYTM